MPTITVRNVPAKVVQSLKALARATTDRWNKRSDILSKDTSLNAAPCSTKSKPGGTNKRAGRRQPKSMPGWASAVRESGR